MVKRICLHLGAHRTGTSSFQLCLYENTPLLKEAGFDVAHPKRDGVPKGRLRLKLPRKRHGAHRVPEYAEGVRAHLAKLGPDPARGLILSEENIPGIMRNFYDGQFYPGSENRLATLAAALGARPEVCLFVLRSYDELYASHFRLAAIERAMPPFADLAPVFAGIEKGWPQIVTEIRDILRPERLLVLPYARRGSNTELLRAMVPDLPAGVLREARKSLNVSPTDSALEVLQRTYHAGAEYDAARAEQIMAEHRDIHEDRGFSAFSEAQRDGLRAKYEADLETIQAMDGVTYL